MLASVLLDCDGLSSTLYILLESHDHLYVISFRSNRQHFCARWMAHTHSILVPCILHHLRRPRVFTMVICAYNYIHAIKMHNITHIGGQELSLSRNRISNVSSSHSMRIPYTSTLSCTICTHARFNPFQGHTILFLRQNHHHLRF